MTLVSFRVGFGLKQEHRSVMALGMCTRNIASVFVAYLGITNPDPGLRVMIAVGGSADGNYLVRCSMRICGPDRQAGVESKAGNL
jgi:hypothetical protein